MDSYGVGVMPDQVRWAVEAFGLLLLCLGSAAGVVICGVVLGVLSD